MNDTDNPEVVVAELDNLVNTALSFSGVADSQTGHVV